MIDPYTYAALSEASAMFDAHMELEPSGRCIPPSSA
jgi:hypothetical protein